MGLQAAYVGAEPLTTLLKRDAMIWGNVIQAAGIKVEQ